MRALLTAFGPFLGRPENQSQQVLEHVLRRMPEPWRAQLLPAHLGQLRLLVAGAARRGDLQVWLALGESGLEGLPALETLARNRYDFSGDPASAGGGDHLGELEEGGPERIDLSSPASLLAAGLRERGHALALSEDAGSHCCNGLLYLASRAFAADPQDQRQVYFLHLPRRPEQLAAQARLVHDALSWLAARHDR